jgi:hypothetical protein
VQGAGQQEPSKGSGPAEKNLAGAAPVVALHASASSAHLVLAAAQAVHSLPSASAGSGTKRIRQQEVEDEEEEDGAIAPCEPGEAYPTSAPPASGPAEGTEDDPDCRVVWDSSHSSHQPKPGQPAAPSCSAAAKLKDQGTACLKQADLPGALACYSGAVKAALADGDDPRALAALYSNKSHVLHKLGRHQEVGGLG